jgi:hypothetical protein
VRLIAVAGEALGHEDFNRIWSGELYFDLGKAGLFKRSGLNYQGLLSGALSYYTGGAVAQHSARCDAKGVTGNMEGEGLKLGGVFAVSPTGEVAYEHKERTWGDTTVVGSRMAELQAAVASFSTGPPADVL